MSDPTTADYPVIRASIVNKKDAIRQAVNYMPLDKNRELVVYWPIQDDKLMTEALRFLDDYGCSDGSKGQTWVDDPVASNEVYTGRWRVVNNRMSAFNEPQGVYQILREGLLRALPVTEDIDTEARLQSESVDTQNGKFVITRYWQGVDPSYDEAIIAARKSTVSRTNITVRGQTYTGTFAVSNVGSEPMPGDGAIKIIEVLTEVATPSSVLTLATETPIRTQEDEILKLFDLETGVGDSVACVYANINQTARAYLMGLSSSTLVTILTGYGSVAWTTSHVYTAGDLVSNTNYLYVCATAHTSGIFADDLTAGKFVICGVKDVLSGLWSYADRKFEDQKDNTAKFLVLAKKVAFQAWDHDSGVADMKEYSNAGTANEKEVITKTWLLIQNADLSTAIAALRTGTTHFAADNGYIITDAYVSDNGDGSLTLRQSQKKQVNAVNVCNTPAGIEYLDPTGPFSEETSAYINYIDVHYEHFTAAGLATAIGTPPTIQGYTLKSVTPSLNGDGLYSAIYHFEKPYFNNTAPTRNVIHQRNVTGLDYSKSDEANAIPSASLSNAFGAVTATSGYVLDSVQMRNNKNGSGSINVTQSALNATSTGYTHSYVPAYGRREETIHVLWKNLSATDKGSIYTDAVTNKANMANSSYNAAPAGHQLQNIMCSDNGNNSWNVERVTCIPIWSEGTDWDGTSSQEFKEEYTTAKFRIASGKYYVRYFRFHVFTLQTKSKGSADSWLTSSHTYKPIYSAIHGGSDVTSTTPVKTHLLFLGKGRYRSIATFASCTEWLYEKTGGAASDHIDNLGVGTGVTP